MAALAISWGGTQVCKRMIILMAFVTRYRDMFPGQFKGHSIMIEGVPIGIDAVMASQAVIPVCLEMGLHEVGFDLFMTVQTDCLIEFGIAIHMTVPATEWGTVGLLLMRSKGIPR